MCICMYICIYTSPYAFLQRVCMHSQVLLSTMHVQVCTLDRCCEYQRTHLLHACYRMCMCAMYIHVYMHIYMYIYMCMHVYIYIYVCMRIRIYAYMYMDVYMCVCVCICVHIYICILEIILDLPFGFPINNIISLYMSTQNGCSPATFLSETESRNM